MWAWHNREIDVPPERRTEMILWLREEMTELEKNMQKNIYLRHFKNELLFDEGIQRKNVKNKTGIWEKENNPDKREGTLFQREYPHGLSFVCNSVLQPTFFCWAHCWKFNYIHRWGCEAQFLSPRERMYSTIRFKIIFKYSCCWVQRKVMEGDNVFPTVPKVKCKSRPVWSNVSYPYILKPFCQSKPGWFKHYVWCPNTHCEVAFFPGKVLHRKFCW